MTKTRYNQYLILLSVDDEDSLQPVSDKYQWKARSATASIS